MPSKTPSRRLRHSCTLLVKAAEKRFAGKRQSVGDVKFLLGLRKGLEERHSALREEISKKGISNERIAKSKRMNALLARLDVLISGKSQLLP